MYIKNNKFNFNFHTYTNYKYNQLTSHFFSQVKPNLI